LCVPGSDGGSDGCGDSSSGIDDGSGRYYDGGSDVMEVVIGTLVLLEK